jgi:hypothetical protein
MKKDSALTLAAILALAIGAGTVLAQSERQTAPTLEPTADIDALRNPAIAATSAPTLGLLAAGHNSFTKTQARRRIEAAGYRDVAGLNLDPQGLWQADAKVAGGAVKVAMDDKGAVSSQ